jgi:hypothetical protein
MFSKKGIWGTLILAIALLGIVLSAGFSSDCGCSNPSGNGGCGAGCWFSGISCGPGQIQWCGTTHNPTCRNLADTPCYSLCSDLLSTGGTCVCGNYVWPNAATTTTTVHQTTTTIYTTTTTVQPCGGINLNTDRNNCGYCGHVCPTDYFCKDAMCQRDFFTTTTTPAQVCNGANMTIDRLNCGYCGHVCPTDYFCKDAMCQRDFFTTTTTGGCSANLTIDRFNCGYCGHVCPTDYFCKDGMCQRDFFTTTTSPSGCSSNVSIDRFNCGYCGHVCPTDYFCKDGMCERDFFTTTTSYSGCQTPLQYGRPEICCDNADNDNDGLIDAADPSCGRDVTFQSGVSDICYGTAHEYSSPLHTESGYFICPYGTDKMRFYLKAISEKSDSLMVYDGDHQNSLMAVLPSNFNKGQYDWTAYYPTSKVKFVFNSDPAAANYGFDVGKIECYNGTMEVWNMSCDSTFCDSRSGYYCNGPVSERRAYFCSEGMCKYTVTGTREASGTCGVYGMTIETDKYSYLPGEQVKIRGNVNNVACAQKFSSDTFVEISTSFGRWTTYTDYSGEYFLPLWSVPAGSYEITAKAYDAPGGNVIAYASKWIIREANEFKVTIQATPMSVLSGEKSEIYGKVTDRGMPVSGATVELRAPWATYILTTNGLGEYSAETWTGWIGNNNITAYAQKDGAKGWASTILSVKSAGNGSEQFTLSAPSIAKPNSVFNAGGSWFVDGVGMNEPFIISFRDTRKTVTPVNGRYNTTLPAPGIEGCWLITARAATTQTCVRVHTRIDLTIERSGENLIFKGAYEDGTPVSGSFSYAIDSGRYVYERMDKGIFTKGQYFAPGRHAVWANLNDGYLYTGATKEFDISSGAATTTVAPAAGQGSSPTTTVAPSANQKITASAPERVELFRWEEKTMAVTVRNTGNAEGKAEVTFGDEKITLTIPAGESRDAEFNVVGTENKEIPLTVISLGNAILNRKVKVIVWEFGINWPKNTFYKGDIAIPYQLVGETTGAVVNESLTEEINGTMLLLSTGISDLPNNGTMSIGLPVGQYWACVNTTNSQGRLIIDGCQEIVVKEGLARSWWFIGAIGGAAILLLLF